METFEEFIESHKEHKKTLVIDGFDVVMLSDFSRDESDWYFDFIDKEGKKYSVSAVVYPVFLKGVIEERKYNHMVWQWNEFFKRKNEELIVQ